MTAAITFTGLGSGLDIQGIMDAQLEAERLRFIAPFEAWKAEWEEKISAFQALNSKLSSLHATIKSLDTLGEFLSKVAVSSDETVVTVQADSTAISDSYTITANQLAQSDKWIHSGLSGTEAVVHTGAAGTFEYSYNGATRSITVVEGTTLDQLVSYINNDLGNLGVRASVLNDGSGSATAYHLLLSGTDTGSDYGITITATLSNLATINFSRTQTAQNAQISVDGYPAGPPWIERSSNTINDVIPGISLDLRTTGTASVTVASDTDSIKDKISQFVDDFNAVRSYIKELTFFDSNDGTHGILQGNYAVDTIKNRLNMILSSPPSGFRDGVDPYISLMQLGISTDVDAGSQTQGQLVLDESVLNDALNQNPDAVANFFSVYMAGRSVSSSIEYVSAIDTITQPGTYQISYNSASPATSQIRMQGGQWYTAIWDEATETLTGPQGSSAAGLVVKVLTPDTSFTGAEIDLRRGISGDIKDELDFLAVSREGPLAVLESNYQSIIDGIDTKIEREEKRIALLKVRLQERYARLEKLLSELNSQGSYVEMRMQQMQS